MTVEVNGLRFDDLDSELVAVEHATLLPGAWRTVRFGAPADCFFGVPRILGSVRLTVLTADGEREQEIPLAGGGRNLLEYHAAMCAPQVLPRPQDLEGVWVVEDAFGGQDFVGIMVWRFGRDGSFVADPEGLALLDVEHGVDGRYTLDDGEMRLHVEGGYGCDPGGTSIWRPSLVEGPRTTSDGQGPLMTVAWVGGECPGDMDGQIWILRRVLDSAQ